MMRFSLFVAVLALSAQAANMPRRNNFAETSTVSRSHTDTNTGNKVLSQATTNFLTGFGLPDKVVPFLSQTYSKV